MKNLFYKKKKREPKKQDYIRLQIELLIMTLLFLSVVYINFDYMVFKMFICRNYIYTDTLDELYLENLEIENTERYSKNFDALAIKLITDEIQEISDDKFTYLFLQNEYADLRNYTKETGSLSNVREINSETIYINITNFSYKSKKSVFDEIESLSGYENLVIDLRDNLGGYLKPAYKMSDYFLDKGATIGYEVSKRSSKEIKSKKNKKLSYNNIYILQNENTASSAETFISALKDNLDNVTLVGTQTYGKGIGQAEFRLKNGYAFKATVLDLRTPENISINKVGIKPDISCDISDTDELIGFILSEDS